MYSTNCKHVLLCILFSGMYLCIYVCISGMYLCIYVCISGMYLYIYVCISGMYLCIYVCNMLVVQSEYHDEETDYKDCCIVATLHAYKRSISSPSNITNTLN